jgi:hypothetical protein
MMKMPKLSVQLITLSCVVQVLGFLVALPGHLSDPTWSNHAQFHHVLGWFWVAGLNTVILILVWGPMRRGERWSFWAVALGYLIAQGGFYLSVLLVWEGRPTETWYYFALGANTLIGLVGILMERNLLQKKVPV